MTRVSLVRVLLAVCLLVGCAASVRAQDAAAAPQLDDASELEFDASQKALLELYNQQQQMASQQEQEEGEILSEKHFDTQLDMEEANMDQLEAQEQAEGQQSRTRSKAGMQQAIVARQRSSRSSFVLWLCLCRRRLSDCSRCEPVG